MSATAIDKKCKCTTVRFLVTGEFLTTFYRNLILEGNWEKSLKDLVETLHGVTYEIVISVLKCETKFVGDSNVGIDIAPELESVRDEFNEKFDWLYCGRVKISDNWYRPYKVIKSYCAEDFNNSCGSPHHTISHTTSLGRTWTRSVCRYTRYSDDIAVLLNSPESIRDDVIKNTVTVLFERTTSPPIWHQFNFFDMQKAFNEYVAIRGRIEYDGAYNYIGFEDCMEPDEKNFDALHKKSLSDADHERRKLTAKERKAESKCEEERDKKRHKEFLQDQREWKNEIIERSNKFGKKDGWIYLDVIDEEKGNYKLKVPRIPFATWALKGTRYSHLIPDWVPVCPPNLKMQMDNQHHSDWMVGAGIDLSDYTQYLLSGPIMKAAYNMLAEMQVLLCKLQCAILLGNGKTSGYIVHPKPNEEVEVGSIIVIPNSSKDYYIPAMTACGTGQGAIITEVGGKLVHLVQVFMSKNVKILYVKDAKKKFLPDMNVEIDCDKGSISVL